MSLATHMRVSALLQQCQSQGIGVYVLRRGDPDAGVLIVKQAHLDGRATVFTRRFDGEGETVWERVLGDDPVPETDADAYLERRAAVDPDIWVVEIELATGQPDLSLL